MTRRFIFCYHKTGTNLFIRIMREMELLCQRPAYIKLGALRQVPDHIEILLSAHSIVSPTFAWPGECKGIRIIRDPRDILVSGYLYHLKCNEPWCINTDFSLNAPILFPRVDYSFEFLSELTKAEYIKSLRGNSYQQNLQSLGQDDGLTFEFNRFASHTFNIMRQWRLEGHHILTVKLEDLAHDYANTILKILEHFEFTPSQIDSLSVSLTKYDINSMSDKQIVNDPFIHSRQNSKWADYLNSKLSREVVTKYGDLISSLGYAL